MSSEEESSDSDSYAPKTTKPKKKLSVERIYQKKTQLEHILLRPDTYIGSVEIETKVSIHSILIIRQLINN
jgi:DNA gyrase/topoisomerase IV subunit B